MTNGENPEPPADSTKDDEAKAKAIPLGIEWIGHDEIPAQWVNHLAMQRDRETVQLTFFQLTPPFTVGTPEEQRQQLEAMGTVKAKAMARLLVPADRLQAFWELIGKQLKAKDAGYFPDDEE
jgi:hypothetical protein